MSPPALAPFRADKPLPSHSLESLREPLYSEQPKPKPDLPVLQLHSVEAPAPLEAAQKPQRRSGQLP